MVTTGDGIFRLELAQVEDPPPAVDPSQAQPGTAHLAFAGADVGKVFADMMELGSGALSEPVEPASGPKAGGLLIYLLDPDVKQGGIRPGTRVARMHRVHEAHAESPR
ncbi:hypothetical protein StoSoilB5_24000 [Arthrobacter sp. StoSoilB5]|nr:hypothetical protein StoSoilB5_24000 [Arthrobacter sp. StoSoilB5]